MIQTIPSKFYKMAVYRQPSSPTPPVQNPSLTLKAVSGTPAIKIKVYEGNPNPVSLSTSINGGTWTAYTVGDTINMSLNDTVAFSGSTTTFSEYDFDTNAYKFEVINGTVDVYGELMSLVNFTSACQYQNQFQRLFQNNEGDCSVRNASGLILPTELFGGCFAYMFEYNTDLQTAPVLPNFVWDGGWNLYYMFDGCSNLTSLSTQFTSWSTSPEVYASWVQDVAANGTFYKSSSLNEEYDGANRIPIGWTVVNI